MFYWYSFRSLADSILEKEEENYAKQTEFIKKQEEAKKATSGGWFSWMRKPTPNPEAEKLLKEAAPDIKLTEDDMAEIYKIVGYDEAIAEVEPPPEYVKIQAYLQLGRVSFSLVGTPHAGGAAQGEAERPLMSVVMSDTTADVVIRPKNICLGLQMNAFHVDEAVTPGSRFSRMISTPAAAQGSKFLEVGFEIAPLKGHADTVARVSMSSTNVVVTKELIDRLGAFFAPRRKLSVKTLRNNTTEKLWNAVATSRAQLERAVKDHKTMDVSVRIEAPSIIVPQDATKLDTMLLVLDLGELSIRSNLKNEEEDEDDDNDDNKEKGEEKKGSNSISNMDDYYDQYSLEADNIQVLLINNSEEAVRARVWRDEKYQSWDTKIVEYFSFSFTLKTCIQPSELTLPTTILSGELPALRMNMSVQKLRRLFSLFKTFTPDKPHDMELADPNAGAEEEDANSNSDSDEEEEEGEGAGGRNRAITAEEYLSEEQQLNMEKQAQLMKLLVDHTEIEASFIVKEVTLSLTDDTDKDNKKDLISVVISRTAAEYNKKTFSMAATASLGSLVVHDCFAKREGLKYPYFATSEMENTHEKNLMTVKYASFERHSPVHNKVDAVVEAEFRKLHLFVNPDTIASLITFSKTLTFLKSSSEAEAAAAAAAAPSSQEQDKGKKEKEKEKKTVSAVANTAAAANIVPGKYKVPEIVKMKVTASVDLVELVLLKKNDRLAEFKISGIHCGVAQKERTMTVTAELESVTLKNPNAEKTGSLYKYVIAKNVTDAKFVSVAYSTYSVEEVGYPGYDAAVEGTFRSMNIIPTLDFLVGIKNYIMDGPLLKALNTDAVKDTVRAKADEVSDKVGDAATELVEKLQEDEGKAMEAEDNDSNNSSSTGKKMKLDITLEAPSIIVPRNSKSRDMVTLRFGVLHVDNEFVEDSALPGSSINRMNIKFSKMLMNAEFDDTVTPVITDISADIVFDNSLNLACKEVPNQRASVLFKTFSLDIKKREVDFVIDYIGDVMRAFNVKGESDSSSEDSDKEETETEKKKEQQAADEKKTKKKNNKDKKNAEEEKAKKETVAVGTFNRKLFDVTAVVEQMSLRLFDDTIKDKEKQIIAFVISDIRADFCKQSFNMQANASIGALMIRDCIAEAAGLEFRYFATSRLTEGDDDGKENMLSVHWEAYQRGTPIYNGVDTLIDATFNNLYFIFNPDTLAATLKLFKSLDFSALQGVPQQYQKPKKSKQTEEEIIEAESESKSEDEKEEQEQEPESEKEEEEEGTKDTHAVKNKISAKLNAIGVVLIKDNKKMADFSISGVQGSVQQKEYSMEVKAEIKDIAFVNRLVELEENSRIIARKDQGKNFASLSYSTYSPKEGAEAYPGYDTYVEAIIRSLDITPSVDFLLELQSYFVDGPLLKVLSDEEIKERVKDKADETSERISEKTREAIQEQAEASTHPNTKNSKKKEKKEGTGKMRLNATLEASNIIVPLSATSTEKVTAKLGSLHAESIPAGEGEDADLDKIRVAFSDMYVETCYKDGTVLPVLKEVSMGVAIDRSLNPGNGRISDMKVDAVCQPFEMQLSEGQVAFLLNFSQRFTESLNAATAKAAKEKEEAEKAKNSEKLIEERLDRMREERLTEHRARRKAAIGNTETRKRRPKKEAVDPKKSGENEETSEQKQQHHQQQQKPKAETSAAVVEDVDCAAFLSETFAGIVPKMDVHFELERITLNLYRGEGADDPLAMFELKGAVAGMKTLPNDFMVAEAVLESIALSDLRHDTRSMYRDMITYGISEETQQQPDEDGKDEKKKKKKKKAFMSAKYVKKVSTGDQAVTLEVYEPTIYVLPDLLISVQNFFVNPLNKGKKKNDNDGEEEEAIIAAAAGKGDNDNDEDSDTEVDISVLVPARPSGEDGTFQTPYVKNVEDEIAGYIRLCRKLRKNTEFRGAFVGSKLTAWIKQRYPDELNDEQAQGIAARMLRRGTIVATCVTNGSEVGTFRETDMYTLRAHRVHGGIRNLLAMSGGSIGDSLLTSSYGSDLMTSSDTEEEENDEEDANKAGAAESKRRPGLYAKVALRMPQIHVLQDEFRDDSFCVWVTGDFDAEYTQSVKGEDVGIVDVHGLRVQLLRMEECRKQLGERVDSILNPLTMNATYNKDKNGAQKVSASIPDGIEVAFSYQNAKLIMGVMDTLSPLWGGDNSSNDTAEQQQQQKKKNKRKSKKEKEKEEEEKRKKREAEEKEKEKNKKKEKKGAESLRFSCPKITVYLINDFGGRNVPVLALGLNNVGVTIRDWSSNMCLVVISDLSTDFFNENLMWYEPLIEPWHFVGCILNDTAASDTDNDGSSSNNNDDTEKKKKSTKSDSRRKRRKIELSARSYLNINITQAFVETIARTYTAISQDYSSIPTREERLRILNAKATGGISSSSNGLSEEDNGGRDQVFRNLYIRNKTYFSMEATVMFDMLSGAVKDEAKARKITVVEDTQSEKIVLGTGEMAPVTLGIGGAEALRTTITQQRIACVKFAGEKKFEVHVDKVGVAVCSSVGADETVVSEVTWNADGSKLATLRAAVQVHNKTDVPVEMLVWKDAAECESNGSKAANPDYTVRVDPGTAEPIPYGTARQGCLRLRPLLEEKEEEEEGYAASDAAVVFSKLVGDMHYSMHCAAQKKDKTAKDMYFMCKIEDMKTGYETPFATIAVYPPAVVTNALPCAVGFKLGHLRGSEYCARVQAEGTLGSGETRNLYWVDPRYEMLLSLQNVLVADPTAYSEPVRVSRISKKKSVCALTLADSAGRKLRIDVETSFSPAREFVLYVPYWLENRSRIPLHYGTAQGVTAPGSTNASLSAAGSDENEKEAEEGEEEEAQRSTVGAMFLYSQEKLCLRAAGSSKWSRMFSIGTVGANGVIEIPGDDAGRTFYSLKVSCYLAEGAFNRTKIVTLAPSTVFVNKLTSGVTLRVRQHGAPKEEERERGKKSGCNNGYCRLRRGEHAPFHWTCFTPGKDISRKLNATVGDGAYEWSGAFTATDVGENYLMLRSADPGARPDYHLRYEVIESSYVTFVVFKDNDPDAPAPYRVENCTNYPVRLRQRGLGDGGGSKAKDKKKAARAAFTTLAPQCTTDFGWVKPLGKKEVELVIDEMGLRESKLVCKMNKIETFKPVVTKGRKTLYTYTRADGPTRVLVITFNKLKFRRETKAFEKDSKYSKDIEKIDEEEEEEEEEEESIALANGGGGGSSEEVEETEMSVDLESGIVVSLVSQKPSEFCVLSVKGISMSYVASVEQLLFEFKLGSLQLDNQDVNAEFPIVLYGARSVRGDEPWLHLSLAKSTLYDTIDYFTYFAFLIQELSISVESDFINTILDFYHSLPIAAFTSSSSSSSSPQTAATGESDSLSASSSRTALTSVSVISCSSTSTTSSLSSSSSSTTTTVARKKKEGPTAAAAEAAEDKRKSAAEILIASSSEHNDDDEEEEEKEEEHKEMKDACDFTSEKDEKTSTKKKQKQQQKQELTEWETEGVTPVTGMSSGDETREKMMYFRLFHLNPIKINFTFTNKPGAVLNLPRNVGSSLIESLVGALANVDNAPLRFNALLLDNPFCTKGALVSMIISHYTRQAVTEVLKLIGSVDVLGNPVGLFTNIGTGVKDFFYEPAQGIVKSPAEFASGLGRGTKSMIKNTVSGLFNSVSKITGALGKGVATLSFDEDYIREHDVLRNKRAMTVGAGVLQGTKAFVLGIAYGVSGLFTKPVLGVMRGGGKGLVLGIYQGVVGVVIKPVTGALDLFSKISEGVKNNALMLDAPEAASRQHPYPRLFGSDDQLIVYSTEEAETAHALASIQGFEDDRYLFDCSLRGQQTLVITDNHISVVKNNDGGNNAGEKNKKKKRWRRKKNLVSTLEYSDGSCFDLCGQSIVAHILKTGRRSELTFDSAAVAARVFEIIQYYIKKGNGGETFTFNEAK